MSDRIKAEISNKQGQVKFYESFMLPVFGGLFALIFTDKVHLINPDTGIYLAYIGLLILVVISYLRAVIMVEIEDLIKKLP